MSDPRDHDLPDSEDEEDFNPAPADVSDDERDEQPRQQARKPSPARNGGGDDEGDEDDEDAEDGVGGGNDDDDEDEDEEDDEEDEVQVSHFPHPLLFAYLLLLSTLYSLLSTGSWDSCLTKPFATGPSSQTSSRQTKCFHRY